MQIPVKQVDVFSFYVTLLLVLEIELYIWINKSYVEVVKDSIIQLI